MVVTKDFARAKEGMTDQYSGAQAKQNICSKGMSTQSGRNGQDIDTLYAELLASHDRLMLLQGHIKSLYDTAPVALLVIDGKNKIIEANQDAEKVLEVNDQSPIGKCITDVVHRTSQDALYHHLRRLRDTGGLQKAEIRLAHDITSNTIKRPVWVDIQSKFIVSPQAREDCIQISLFDISPHKLAQEDLTANRDLLNSIIEISPDMISYKDNQCIYRAANKSFCDFFGSSGDAILENTDYSFCSESYAARMIEEDNNICTKVCATQRVECIEGVSDKRWFSISKTPIISSNGTVEGILSSYHDITALKEYENKMWHEANFDSLTHLPNRSLFLDRLNQHIHLGNREKKRFALMFIDLDRFKWINDRMGHNAGDLVLIEAARRMEKCIRESDTIARISGDEFTIILADIKSPMDIECVSDKILSCIEKPFEINANDKLHITASVGVTLYPDDSVVAVELMRKADIAMYRAKESGRNRTVFFTEEMDRSFQERISLEKDLLQAIKYKEWVLYYQPIIDLANNEVVAVEALVRWNHPKLGLLQPNKFIALAEETGLITQLGDWVINEVAMQSKAWTKEGVRPIGISVNVSSRQCKEIDFEEKLENLILDHKSLGGVIRLEITESIMLEQCDLNLKLLQRLKKLGITFSLDDFGTGYSSLIQLKRFPFECLKIEREFIKDVLDDPSDATLVKAIIDLAHNFNMRIVAEGIESREQLEFLREAGADFGQGFYFSKPLMAHDLVKCIVAPEKQDKTGC